MSYDELKVEKLRDFVSCLEAGEVTLTIEGDRRELARRVKAQIQWLEDKIERDRLQPTVA